MKCGYGSIAVPLKLLKILIPCMFVVYPCCVSLFYERVVVYLSSSTMNQKFHIYKAHLFKALAHPLRLAILDALRDGEKTVTQLQEITGGEQASISQHLKILRHHHFITFRKEGTLAFYWNEDPDVYLFLDLGLQVYERQIMRQREHLDSLSDNNDDDSSSKEPFS